VHSRLKSLVVQAGLKGRVRVNHAGCLDQCGFGPMMVVYPDNVYSETEYTAGEQSIPQTPVLRGRALPAVTLPACR
jgi:NADH:ubiquinone oxidoreductase subunit E